MPRGSGLLRAAIAALAALAASAAPPAPARPCVGNELCVCRADHFACSDVPFHRFPETGSEVRHVSLWAARLGALGEAALDARPLRTLVLAASRLHHLHPDALASMTTTLASLDLGHNEFTEVPIESLRDLRALNWLSLQSNRIAELPPEAEWGTLADSLSSLSLANNQLVALRPGALAGLRRLAALELDGNRLRALAPGALPAALGVLRLAANLLPRVPCAALAPLRRLRRLTLRDNLLAAAPEPDAACRAEPLHLDSVDLSHNELRDGFEANLELRVRPRELVLDLNDLTAVPPLALDGERLERLSISQNRLSSLSDAAVRALRRRLERLELDRNELRALPAALADMARLRHLSLAHNELERADALPPHLRHLSLAGNRLAAFPAGLHSLAPATLEHLDLGYNRIATVGAADFGDWADALVTLVLRGNRISRLASDAFPPALPLRELVLGYNELYHVSRGAFANLTALRALELSSALLRGELPPIAPSDSLSWLSLDNNDIHYFSEMQLQCFPSLEYLNLNFNEIVEFPSETSDKIASYGLKELRLSYNFISRVSGRFLGELSQLQTLDLSYNRIRNITEQNFANLPSLVYLNLVGNAIEHVSHESFRDLPRLEVLELQENVLMEFTTRSFANVSHEEINLSVNISRNRITSLVGGAAVAIDVLDLSHNLIECVPRAFLEALGPHIRRLVLAHNRLTQLDTLGGVALPRLAALDARHNNVSSVRRRALAAAPALQELDLAHNRLARLAADQFRALRRLRRLDLAANRLGAVPRDALADTVLEHLDLADNRLAAFPAAALAAVGFTLRALELARNRLPRLDAAAPRATPFLRELGLAGNGLTALPGDALAGLARLRRLDLSHNALEADYGELLSGAPRLRALALVGVGLRAVPALPLANLVELDLADNRVADLAPASLAELRALRLAGNALVALRPAAWAALPRLVDLDVSRNPLKRIPASAFEGLDRLQRLRLDGLARLERLDPRALRPLAALRGLALDAAGGGASFALLLAGAPGLEALEVVVREAALDGQLDGLRAPRLRALALSGAALRRVSARALAALGAQRALTLRLTRTGVTVLPAGLLRPLARVPHLALDLSDNRLVALEPDALYANLSAPPGGLVAARNPLRCGCGAARAGAWLRRWAGEAGGGTPAALAAARRSTCEAGGEGGERGGGAVALVSLRGEAAAARCRPRALTGRAPPPPPTAPLLWLALLHVLS